MQHSRVALEWTGRYAQPVCPCENVRDTMLVPGSGAVTWPGVPLTTPPRRFAMAAADRHLLFGLLALQTGIINQGQLVAAFQAWTLDKARSLADHLEARGDLTAAKRAAARRAGRRFIWKRTAAMSRRAWPPCPSSRSTRASLAGLGEPDIEATLARITRSKNGQATEPDDR